MSTLGNRLKELRKEHNYNQSEFGLRIGISMSAVSLLEKGTNNPSEQTIRAICSEFGVRREWLLDGEKPKYPPDAENDIAIVTRALEGQSEAKKLLIRIIAEMPDDLADAIIAYMDGRQKK